MKKRECDSSLYNGGRLLLDAEERVSLFLIDRRQTASICRGESISLLYREQPDSLSSIHREGVDLFFVESGDTLSVAQKRSLPTLYKEERRFLLFVEEESTRSQ